MYVTGSFIWRLTLVTVYFIFSMLPNILFIYPSNSSWLPNMLDIDEVIFWKLVLSVTNLSNPFSNRLGKLSNLNVCPVGAVSNMVKSYAKLSTVLNMFRVYYNTSSILRSSWPHRYLVRSLWFRRASSWCLDRPRSLTSWEASSYRDLWWDQSPWRTSCRFPAPLMAPWRTSDQNSRSNCELDRWIWVEPYYVWWWCIYLFTVLGIQRG